MRKIHATNKCVTTTAPAMPANDFLVVYSERTTSPYTFVNSYLRAAQAIVSLTTEKMGAMEDAFAIPLLNLYVNSIEFSLKFAIERLEEHRCKKTCKCIKTPPLGFNKIVYCSHDLVKLGEILKDMHPDQGMLHQIPQLDDILVFLKDLKAIGIASESTRYLTDTDGTTYDIYKKQHWIYPAFLHETVHTVIHLLLDAVLGDEFELCSTNEFSKERLTDIRSCEYYLKSNRGILEALKNEDDSDVFDFDKMSENVAQRNKLMEQLEVKNQDELAIICMGLYLARGLGQVENLDYFKKWEKDELIRKICERAHHIDQAEAEIKEQIVTIDAKRKMRGL
jgi:hypothetical protein